MATAQNIVDGAYNKIGLSTISSTKSDKALVSLNNMISIWSIDGLIVPFRTSESFSLVVGQSSYTIGTSGNINTVRPLEIMQMYIRDSSDVDYILTQIDQRQYAELTNKTVDCRPSRFYYDPQYSLGKIYFDSEPAAVETCYIISEKPFTELATLATAVSLPDFYKEALIFNLAVRLAVDEQIILNDTIITLAISGKSMVENYVAKDKLARTAKMDNAILYRGSTLNITTGE